MSSPEFPAAAASMENAIPLASLATDEMARAKLDFLEKTAATGTWSVDLDTGVFECSSLSAEIFGIDPNENPGASQLLSRITPSQRSTMHELLTGKLGAAGPIDFAMLSGQQATLAWQQVDNLLLGTCCVSDTASVLELLAIPIYKITDSNQMSPINNAARELNPDADYDWLVNAVVLKGTVFPPGNWPSQLERNSYIRDIEIRLDSGRRLAVELWTLVTNAGRFVVLSKQTEGWQPKIEDTTSNLQQVLDELPFTAMVFESTGVPCMVNRYGAMLLGIEKPEEFNYLRLFKAGTDTHLLQEDLPVATVVRTRQPAIVYDIEMIQPNGKRTAVLIWAKPVSFNDDGSVDQVIMLGLGGSQHSLLKALEKARLEAKSAETAKNQFLSNISHEFQTPLTATLGFLQLVQQDSSLPPDQARNVDLAIGGARKLQSLIRDVLEVTLIESSELKIEHDAFDVAELVEEVGQEFKPAADAKGLSFHWYRDAELGNIDSDPEKMRQILSCLVDNAIKFTSAGSVTLSVSHDYDNLIIEVTDTGRGIASEQLDRLFDAFQSQLDYQLEQGKAIGLGLAICNSYTQLMGGKITVSSNVGQGTIFRVVLPDLVTAGVSGQPQTSGGNQQSTEVPLAEALGVLSAAKREELRQNLLRADPSSFQVALAEAGLNRSVSYQIESMVKSYQYEAVLLLLEDVA
jgi:signal transduction histidine kinase